MNCASCGVENDPSNRFCNSCGGRLAAACPACGTPQSDGARFCASCGHQLTGTPASGPQQDASTAELPVKTIEFLGKVSIFGNLKAEVLSDIATRLQLVSIDEGPIFREGDAVDGLYVISAGKAKVTKPAEGGGPEAVLAILGEGDSFGEVGLVDGLPRSAGVAAMMPMECYFLGRAAFLKVLEANPEMAISMLPALASMVRNADDWVSRTI